MTPIFVVISFELRELAIEIRCRPEKQLIQALTAKGSDQPFDERMRHGNERHRLDFLDLKDAEVGLPLLEPIQRIMIRTDIFRESRASNGVLEHAAKGHPIDNSGLNPKTHNPPRVLIDDDQNPICSQCDGLTSHEIDAPQTVLHMPEER